MDEVELPSDCHHSCFAGDKISILSSISVLVFPECSLLNATRLGRDQPVLLPDEIITTGSSYGESRPSLQLQYERLRIYRSSDQTIVVRVYCQVTIVLTCNDQEQNTFSDKMAIKERKTKNGALKIFTEILYYNHNNFLIFSHFNLSSRTS